MSETKRNGDDSESSPVDSDKRSSVTPFPKTMNPYLSGRNRKELP